MQRPKIKKMTRVYFSLYHWVLFLFLGFSLFPQISYLVFRQGLRRNLQITNYTARDIYQLWFSQGKGCEPTSCISQSLYSLIHVMIEVCYVIVYVITFKACEKIFISFSQRHIHCVFPIIGMCMIGVNDKQPCAPVWNVASCDLRVLLDDSLVSSNIKHDSVIYWCTGVSVQAVSKKFFVKKKKPHPKSARAVPRTSVVSYKKTLWAQPVDIRMLPSRWASRNEIIWCQSNLTVNVFHVFAWIMHEVIIFKWAK